MKSNVQENVYYVRIVSNDWSLYIAATEKGLCFVGSHDEGYEEMKSWFAIRRSNAVLIEDLNRLSDYKEQLLEYLTGAREHFHLPIDSIGTDFQTAVWNELQKIPFGKTATYSDIAEQIRRPASVRAVGTAIGSNPVLIVVPCHRVIAKSGRMAGYRGGIPMKERLLGLERSLD
ncbi:methylated-DNA--[protein]-cysteine S-methyltransferase [Oceanobacillus saliphilus]|uniref:methylated-DNA--[protein]-cysteine S-methyltransferase n=1 Tax=Oceanobacillus saliphilus TaxID=2925834 RepID=UPI00201E357D|nr:methylated-DNA--[protein]-cysteine S-methyltransferase [Oceanobacillus saliphilus]